MYQKHAKSVFNLLSNFGQLKSKSKFSQGLYEKDTEKKEHWKLW